MGDAVQDEEGAQVVVSYDLWSEPWIPVLQGGRPGLVSIDGAIRSASTIDDLDPALPTQAVAVLRQVLIPLLVDVLGPFKSADDWRRRFEKGVFLDESTEEAFRRYRDDYRARFDLFSPDTPFAQVGDLRTAKGERKSPLLLVPTTASGNNSPIFASFTEGDLFALTASEAALWLLHTQCWDTAAIKSGAVGDPEAKAGKTTGNPVSALGALGVAVPMGATLFETLMLNLPVGEGRPLGRPQWRADPLTAAWTPRPAKGILDLLTWQSRRIRLYPEILDGEIRVVGALVAAGDRLHTVPEYEPHTLWRRVKDKKGATISVPARHRPGRAAWRGLDALVAVRSMDDDSGRTSDLLIQVADLVVAGALPEEFPLQVQICGVEYGNQSAVVEDVIADRIPLPVLALTADTEIRELVLDCAETAERLSDAVNRLHADLRRAVSADPVPWNKGERPGERLLHSLDRRVRALLAALRHSRNSDHCLQGRRAWETVAWQESRALARQIHSEFPARVFVGHIDREKNRTFRESDAINRFSWTLRELLPLAAQPDTPEE